MNYRSRALSLVQTSAVCLRRSLLIVSVLLIALSANLVPTASAKDEWTQVRTRNFTLVGNASERDIRRVATELEQFRAAFGRLFPKARLQSSVPTRVIVFKNDSSFLPFKPVHQGKPAAVSGYFQSGSDVNYIALAPQTREGRPYGIIFHEYVHFLTRNNARNMPVWFNEGLAEYYSTFEVHDDGTKILLGRPIVSHVHHLRQQQIVPLQTLFGVSHNSDHYTEREKKGTFYAQSWALMHFFLQGDEKKHRPAFGDFLTLLAEGKPMDESFRQAFKTDFAKLEADLRNYISRKQYAYDEIILSDRLNVDSEIDVSSLSDADAQYFLGDLLLHTQRISEAEGRLQQAITVDGKHAGANASMGMLRMRQNRFAEAKQHMATAANSESAVANPLIHYYYASTISREQRSVDNTVSGFTPESLELMRTQLRKSIQLAPNFAEAYRLLAFVELVAGENLKEAERLIRHAQTLSLGEPEYGYLLAQILLRDGRFGEARAALVPVLGGAIDEGLRSRAESLLVRVNSALTRGSNVADARSSVPTPATAITGETDGERSPGAPALRYRAGREEKIEGLMMDIGCVGDNLTLTVKVGERLIKLWASSRDKVRFLSFDPGADTMLICGPQRVPARVRVTYKPLAAGELKDRGEGAPVLVEYLAP